MTARVLKTEDYYIEHAPYYEPIGDEFEVFEADYRKKTAVSESISSRLALAMSPCSGYD